MEEDKRWLNSYEPVKILADEKPENLKKYLRDRFAKAIKAGRKKMRELRGWESGL